VHPYRIGAVILGSLALLIGGFLVVGILLPSGWDAERTIRIQASAHEVYAYLDRAERWGEWTPSPDAGVELFGPEIGVGSGRRWDDPGYGSGEFVITGSEPPSELTYDVAVEGGAIRIQGRILLEPDDEGTLVRWREEGDFGWNPLLGYLAGRMNELQGAQLEASLAALAELATNRPLTGEPD
jgi:hypothetical protein